jgi:glycosyltransferase involved in cell wall biosynthesis
MKIAIITDSFPPLKNSGAVQVMDLALEFIRQGNQVTVITPSSEIIVNFLIDSLENVQIIRLKSPKFRDVSYIRRVVGEFLMPFSMIYNLKRSSVSISQFDGVVTYAPSIFLGPVAKKIKKNSQCKNYLIIRDIFPQWAVDLGLISKNWLPYFFFKLVEKNLYSTADIIGMQTLANMPYFQKEIPGNVTIEVLQNWLSKEEKSVNYCSIEVEGTKLKGRNIFIYAGNMGDAQGLEIFIDVANEFAGNTKVGFLFVGRGSAASRLRMDSEKRKLDNILFYNEISPKEIPRLYEQCSYGIISLDKRHKTHNIPGKFLSYMRSGLPVLAVINKNNDLEKIIQENSVGRVVTNHSVKLLVDIINELLNNSFNADDMKKRCQKLHKELFSTEKVVKQIAHGLD